MSTEDFGPERSNIFLRLVERSKRMLQQRPGAARDELAQLPTLIESEIIPRLKMTLNASQTAEQWSQESEQPQGIDVSAFIAQLLSSEPDDARHTIEALREQGFTLVEIYGELLMPAARELGEMWNDDLCSFAEVTIAIMKIRHIFAATAPLFPVTTASKADDAPAIIMTTLPGEQHTFGMYLALEHFREANWHVWSGSPRNKQELINLVESEHCDIVGISVGATRDLNAVQSAISEIRAHSSNPDVKVIAGGQLVDQDPELFEIAGFDLLSSDIDAIVAQATSLLPSSEDTAP